MIIILLSSPIRTFSFASLIANSVRVSHLAIRLLGRAVHFLHLHTFHKRSLMASCGPSLLSLTCLLLAWTLFRDAWLVFSQPRMECDSRVRFVDTSRLVMNWSSSMDGKDSWMVQIGPSIGIQNLLNKFARLLLGAPRTFLDEPSMPLTERLTLYHLQSLMYRN